MNDIWKRGSGVPQEERDITEHIMEIVGEEDIFKLGSFNKQLAQQIERHYTGFCTEQCVKEVIKLIKNNSISMSQFVRYSKLAYKKTKTENGRKLLLNDMKQALLVICKDVCPIITRNNAFLMDDWFIFEIPITQYELDLLPRNSDPTSKYGIIEENTIIFETDIDYGPYRNILYVSQDSSSYDTQTELE